MAIGSLVKANSLLSIFIGLKINDSYPLGCLKLKIIFFVGDDFPTVVKLVVRAITNFHV